MCELTKSYRIYSFLKRLEKSVRKVVWNGIDLENIHPNYLGVTHDRTLGYKHHIQNTKMKVETCNNLLKKLDNSKWGTNARTIKTTALSQFYSIAEYPAPI